MKLSSLLSTAIFAISLLLVTSGTIAAPKPDAAPGPKLSMGEAINKAGRQRMLSQRITKAYALIGQKIMMSANNQLYDAIELFGKQHAELTNFAATEEEKTSIEKVSKLWTEYKSLAQTKPTKESALQMRNLSEKVLAEAHHFVLLLAKRSGTPAGHLVNISGRQRMLSQRIGKFYVLQSWGLEDPEYQTEYDKAVNQFTTAMKELQNAPENTSDINDALAKVETDWETFKISRKVRGGKHIPSLVVRQLDKILGQMNYITALYAAVHK